MYAKKSLGQHFLTSPSAVMRIIEAAHLTKKDTVLEIGPGTGVLTKELFSHAGKVIAIEKDGALVVQLQETYRHEIDAGMLEVIHGDILTIDRLSHGLFRASFKVVANIPYYITGAILRKLFSVEVLPTDIVLLVQKEVAERIARDTKESILSLSVKAYGTPKYIHTVKAGSFSPPPKVDSAILAIEQISRDFFTDIKEVLFFDVIKAGFKSKRKFLINNIHSYGTKDILGNIFSHAGIPLTARAEDISLEKWHEIVAGIASIKT
jgi:16S rRNA (adenine1518-N6/adenine1519-N6)-dimethyltransferase